MNTAKQPRQSTFMEFGNVTKRKTKGPSYKVNPTEFAKSLIRHQGYENALRITGTLKVKTFGEAINEQSSFYESAYNTVKSLSPKKS